MLSLSRAAASGTVKKTVGSGSVVGVRVGFTPTSIRLAKNAPFSAKKLKTLDILCQEAVVQPKSSFTFP